MIFVLADYHIHTNFSDDSTYPMEDCVAHFVELGFDEICFTEHTDYGVNNNLQVCDVAAYKKEFERCREKFGGKITLKFGMEFGVQTGTVAEFQKMFDENPFDFIILSNHQVDNKEYWKYEPQEGHTQKEYNDRYYEEILAVMKKFRDFSVLGHLDMIRRYDKAGDYPFEKVKDTVTEILREVISMGKGIEVNTSSHRYKLPDLTPAREILRLYRDLGGEILTIGSDSHEAAHNGFMIKETREELKSMGFKHFYTFDKMNPIAHDL